MLALLLQVHKIQGGWCHVFGRHRLSGLITALFRDMRKEQSEDRVLLD